MSTPLEQTADAQRLQREFHKRGQELEQVRVDSREAAARLAVIERSGAQDRDLREVRAERAQLQHEVSTAAERAAQAGEAKALSHLRLLHAQAEADRAQAAQAGKPSFGAGALQLEARTVYGEDINIDKRDTWPAAAARAGQRERERLERELSREQRHHDTI